MTSTLALVVALGGGAYAASLADDSVGTKHLKDDAVTNAKIANGAVGTGQLKKNAVVAGKIKGDAVTSEKIANNGVNYMDIAPDAVDASHIYNGSVGADELAPSAEKVFGHDVNKKTTPNVTLPTSSQNPNQLGNGFARASVDCDPGKVVSGGGFWISHADVTVFWSKPTDENTWEVVAHNPTNNADRQIVAHVVCVNG